MTNTDQNLRRALAAEAESSALFAAFAGKAEEDGWTGVARFFRAAAAAKAVHARSHWAALGEAQEPLENLRFAFDRETSFCVDMCPPMVQDARAESRAEARQSLEYAIMIGSVLTRLIRGLLGDSGLSAATSYHVCPVCGNVVANETPKNCEYCGTRGRVV